MPTGSGMYRSTLVTCSALVPDEHGPLTVALTLHPESPALMIDVLAPTLSGSGRDGQAIWRDGRWKVLSGLTRRSPQAVARAVLDRGTWIDGPPDLARAVVMDTLQRVGGTAS